MEPAATTKPVTITHPVTATRPVGAGGDLAVSTGGLTKTYGTTTVVDRLDLRIPQGCVYGFLGPNGSGKSTTMKMLLGLVRPSAGEARIFGTPMTPRSRRGLLAGIGSLIESPPGYAHLTGAENMRIVARMLRLPADRIAWAIDAVRLGDQLDKKVAAYSLGMKQRLGIAMALARAPRLLILDESTNGLDPAGIEEIRVLLRELASAGVTVMVSSHMLGEIDRTATVLGILSRGRMLFQGTRAELFAASTPDVVIRCTDPRAAQSALSARPAARLDADGALRLTGADDAAIAHAVASIVRDGVGIHEVRRDEQSLEDVFMDLTRGGGL